MDELLQDFLVEAGEHVEAAASHIVAFEHDSRNSEAIAILYRLVHTIQGACGFLDLHRLERLAHAAETLIGRVRDAGYAAPPAVTLILATIDRVKLLLAEIERVGGDPPGADSDLIASLEAAASGSEAFAPPPAAALAHDDAPPSDPSPAAAREAANIRVSIDTLERIMRLVSELVLTRNQLLDVSRSQTDERLTAPLQRLSNLTSDLQDGVMRARMQPIDRLFTKLPRLARDLAVELDKKIDLVLEGADTELDRQLVETLRDPLMHIIRNCADHGLESAAERERAGKPVAGRIRVRAAHEAGLLVVEVSDDGRGLDLDRIRAKALAQGLATEAELAAMAPADVHRFIFAPGFSTAAAITNVSGRGVGMDVVRSCVESVGGSVEIASQPGAGSRFTIKLPLTLAIAPALVIACAGQRFALPQQYVTEAVATIVEDGSRLHVVGGALMARLRGAVMPIVDLRQVLQLEQLADPCAHDGLVVVIRTARASYGLLVDAVVDFQEIVVKPLGAALSRLPVYAGNTILGDGSVVLILDPDGVAAACDVPALDRERQEIEAAPQTQGHEPINLLLFRGEPSGPLKALPLSLISRIVTATRAELQIADGLATLSRQGSLMPLNLLCDPETDSDRADWPVLVAGVGGEPMGLLVSEIVDVVAERICIDIGGASESCVGWGVVRGERTEILDITHYMQQARPEAFRRGHARKFVALLVDDKPFFRDLLAPVLMAAGYDVCTAGSGAEALSLVARRRDVDVVVSDVEMPEMDGYSLAAALREKGFAKPLVALDAYAGESVIAAARAAGFVTVVGKFDRKRLLAALRETLDAAAFSHAELESRRLETAA
ncbi:MAG TPA: hybrid sensor histidine kinase/response regulator [Beijerinckiaceae bacterium]|jgi:two-component system chemotaxis sensor kinase CheA